MNNYSVTVLILLAYQFRCVLCELQYNDLWWIPFLVFVIGTAIIIGLILFFCFREKCFKACNKGRTVTYVNQRNETPCRSETPYYIENPIDTQNHNMFASYTPKNQARDEAEENANKNESDDSFGNESVTTYHSETSNNNQNEDRLSTANGEITSNAKINQEINNSNEHVSIPMPALPEPINPPNLKQP